MCYCHPITTKYTKQILNSDFVHLVYFVVVQLFFDDAECFDALDDFLLLFSV